MTPATVVRAWRVAGRVQGVGFRAVVRRRARALGITGYARNMPDGTVEVLARGDTEALAALLVELQRGPRHARVTDVTEISVPESTVLDHEAGRDTFVVR